MPSSLRLGALLFAAVKADETSLMQDVKKSSKRDGKHMSALMESAKDMLKNGATADVVVFAEETLAEIAGVVIPALIDETRIQQHLVFSKYQRTRDLIDDSLPQWKAAIHQWSSEVQTASATHVTCRELEHCKCYGPSPDGPDCLQPKRLCEMELYHLWGLWVTAETELRETHTDIDGHFCPPGANGTTRVFRQDSVTWMHEYMRRKELADEAELAYDTYRPDCISAHDRLDDQSAICNAAQGDLETKACSESRAVHQTLQDFEREYTEAHTEIEATWANARRDELVRHEEYRQIKVVECLLERIHELNGRPCDEASGEIDTEMSHCHAEGEAIQVCDFDQSTATQVVSVRYEIRDEAVQHARDQAPLPAGWKFLDSFVEAPHVGAICLLYPEEPVRPPFCLIGTSIMPEPCLPVAPPHPCDPLWTSAQITPLPGFPVAPFSEINPGCNAYPSCSACDLSEFDQVESENHVATAVILVDGCFEQNTEVEREVAHIGDGRTGAVRCCSHAGDTCDTDHLPEGCQTDRTFEEAVELCELNGERLCTQTEIEARVCCGTGCGHDGRKVWVAPQTHSVYGN